MTHTNKGDAEFGFMIILFLVILFIVWIYMGGSKESDQAQKPFINPYNNSGAPLQTYGPNEPH